MFFCCVYIIYCTLCKYPYIGETGRKIYQRIYEHLNSINRLFLIPGFLHFNLRHHQIGHFKFFIYATDLDTHFRKFTEKKLIKISTLQGIRLINEDLSLPIFNIYKLRI